MKKLLLVLIFTTVFITDVLSQQSNRIGFRYRITQEKAREMEEKGFFFEVDGRTERQIQAKVAADGSLTGRIDEKTTPKRVHLCPNIATFQCLITPKDGILLVDPWTITDARTNRSKENMVDPCFDIDTLINANTDNKIKINLSRKKVGNSTSSITIPYRTWILTVGIVGLKFRPSVQDYANKEYFPSVISGTINLGLSYGHSFGWTKFTHRSSNSISITPSGFLGFGSVKLKDEPLKDNINLIGISTNLILSPGIGLTVARNDIGLIFAYGADIMIGEGSKAWAYQGKRFFSIGVAANLKL